MLRTEVVAQLAARLLLKPQFLGSNPTIVKYFDYGLSMAQIEEIKKDTLGMARLKKRIDC